MVVINKRWVVKEIQNCYIDHFKRNVGSNASTLTLMDIPIPMNPI